jgi:hypothetical protein
MGRKAVPVYAEIRFVVTDKEADWSSQDDGKDVSDVQCTTTKPAHVHFSSEQLLPDYD